MHTSMMIISGLALLAVFAGIGRVLGVDIMRAAIWFVPVWLGCALINMYIGVTQAGYTVAQEAPVTAAIFGVPALAALMLRHWVK